MRLLINIGSVFWRARRSACAALSRKYEASATNQLALDGPDFIDYVRFPTVKTDQLFRTMASASSSTQPKPNLESVCRSTRGKGAQSVGGAAVNLRSVLAAVARSFEVRRNENGLRLVRDRALTLFSRAKADEAKIDDEE